MNLKIELDNPKYCDRCPCFKLKIYGLLGAEKKCNLGYSPIIYFHKTFIRPQKCIEENGE